MNSTRDFLQERYTTLWNGAIEDVRAGRVTVDPLLASRRPDQRRCITLLVRPSNEIQGRVTGLLDRLREVDPEQYYYAPVEFNVTVLSLFTATLEHARYLVRYEDYLAAVKAAVGGMRAFDIEFTGVTLTREAVMIQGFPDDTVLNDTRQALRQELQARGLTEGLDSRYVLQTAHMTVVRFRQPLRESAHFAGVLEHFRDHAFGRSPVHELNLVQNDWYMSQASMEVLERYQLSVNSVSQGL